MYKHGSLSSHIKEMHDNDFLACSQCEYTSRRSQSLKSHIEINHEGLKKLCDEEGCSYSCSSQGTLNEHRNTTHGNRTLCCDMCNHRTKRFEQLSRHKADKHEGKRYRCSLCSHDMKRLDQLKHHLKVVHNHESKLETVDIEMSCATQLSKTEED